MSQQPTPVKQQSALHVVYDKGEAMSLWFFKSEIGGLECNKGREVEFFTLDTVPGPLNEHTELWVLPSDRLNTFDKVIKEAARVARDLDYKQMGTMFNAVAVSVAVEDNVGQMVKDASAQMSKLLDEKRDDFEAEHEAEGIATTQKVEALSALIKRELESGVALGSAVLVDSLKKVIELTDSIHVDTKKEQRKAIVDALKERGISGKEASFEATSEGELKRLLNNTVSQFDEMQDIHPSIARGLGQWQLEQIEPGKVASNLRELRSAMKKDSAITEGGRGPGISGRVK